MPCDKMDFKRGHPKQKGVKGGGGLVKYLLTLKWHNVLILKIAIKKHSRQDKNILQTFLLLSDDV